MTPPPSISVVTISFRDLPGLRATIESVRAQQYDGHVEHIVIDGGSGDDVAQFLSAQTGLAYWQSRRDGGRYDAMNQGVARASNDVVWMMHSGDRFSDPLALDAVGRAIAKAGPPRDLWGYAQVNRVGSLGNSLGVWDSIPFDLHKFSTGRVSIPHQGAFFGASVCERLGEYDVEFGLAADQLYILRAALEQPPLTVPRVVCDFDASGAGSVLTIHEIYENVRRAWDLLPYYPWGTRRRSLARLRLAEYRTRAVFAAARIAISTRNRFHR